MDEGLDSTTDEDEVLDPDEDTQDDDLGDTEENTQDDTEPDVDWETRYRALQSRWTRTQQELRQRENQLLELATRQQQGGQEAEADPEQPGYVPPQVARELEELRQYREMQEWESAKAEYGEPVADAYETFQRGWQLDPSPRGAYQAFLDAINVLAEAEVEDSAPRTRTQAVKPRVDNNRQEAPDRSQLDKQLEDAKAGRGKDPLAAGIDAILRKAGLS